MKQDEEIKETQEEVRVPDTWGKVKNEYIRYKGVRMYIKDYLRKLAKDLPPLIIEETNQLVDHLKQLQDAYCISKLDGVQTYEIKVREVNMKAKMAVAASQKYKDLSLRARHALSAYYGKDFDAEPMESFTPLLEIDFERLKNQKNVGAGTLAEIKALLEYVKDGAWLRESVV